MSDRVSIAEAALRLDVSAETIRRWIHEGEFPNAYKKRPTAKNSAFVIPLSDITNFEARRHENNSKE